MGRELHKHNGGSTDIPLEIEGLVACLSGTISQAGLLCRTSRKINELTLLDVKFQLPLAGCYSTRTDRWIECSGVVVHCEKKAQNTEESATEFPYEISIFFDRISDQHRRILAGFS